MGWTKKLKSLARHACGCHIHACLLSATFTIAFFPGMEEREDKKELFLLPLLPLLPLLHAWE